MEGEIFSIIGICLLLVGIITSTIGNVKYNGHHKPADSGYREEEGDKRTLMLVSVITLSTGYILSAFGFAINTDSLRYTAKPLRHYAPRSA